MSALFQALTQLRNGGMVILVDDEDRENEGDLVIAAEYATPEAINFRARFGRGLICLALTGEQVDRLGLSPMVANNRARRHASSSELVRRVEELERRLAAIEKGA